MARETTELLSIAAPSTSRRDFLTQAATLGSLLALSGSTSVQAVDTKPGQKINNASLIPKILPDSEVKLEGHSPDWVKSLIMAQLRIETATPEGTFASATAVLDHYAEMGVNGLWINPIYERGSKSNGYGNFGLHTIEPLLTGGTNKEESLGVVRQFVKEVHQRNIRVIFDIVVWGTAKHAPLVSEHPEFYRKESAGQLFECWGGYGFDWTSEPFRAWFKAAAVKFIESTGADGFRVDLAPDTSGYFFQEIRDALYAKGHKIILVSELNSRRRDTFDFEQFGVHGWTEEPDYVTPGKIKQQQKTFGKHHDFLLNHNIVDAIQSGTGIGSATLYKAGKGGTFRYYTSNLLTHDDALPFVQGNRVRMAYTSILAPFLPMWWIGEEWNNPQSPLPDPSGTGVMYFNKIDWAEKDRPANQAFLEDVKRYIRIRRSLPSLFETFPENHRHANITKLDTTCNGRSNPLQAYARYGAGKSVLVVPHYQGKGRATFTITPDYAALQLDTARLFQITDLMTGEVINTGSLAKLKRLTAEIDADHLGIYLLEPLPQ